MPIENTVEAIKKLSRFVREFETTCISLTPNEFLDLQVKRANGRPLKENFVESFILFMKHRDFFETLTQEFWKAYDLQAMNKQIVMALIFSLIFGLTPENYQTTEDAFKNLSYKHCLEVAEFFTKEEHILKTAQAGCKYFDNEYILENILQPLFNKAILIKQLCDNVRLHVEAKEAIFKRSPTNPEGPSMLQRPTSKRAVSPQQKISMTSTPSIGQVGKGIKVPTAIYTGDITLTMNLEAEFEKNRKRAEELLRLAQRDAFHCAKTVSKIPVPVKEASFVFRANKAPTKSEVSIKSNAATILREAAILEKEEQKECKRIENVLQGAFDDSKITALEEEIRQALEEQNLQEIERKHLLGQISHEEAILAKQQLLEQNKQKMEEFKEERAALLAEIEKWRENELEIIKQKVEKSQSIHKGARESEKKLYVNRQRNAKLINHESKKLLKAAYEEKEKELQRKVELISELRALQQMRTLQIKEFDPTECPNFGLLCEMSIAELQERLGLLRIDLEKELNEKRENIQAEKQRQQKVIEDMKNFIDHARTTKQKPQQRLRANPKPNSEIIALREKLEQTRNLRRRF